MYIPNELLLIIFSFLDYTDLHNLYLVNTNFYNLAKIIIKKKDRDLILKTEQILTHHLLDISDLNYYFPPIFPLKKLVKDNILYFRSPNIKHELRIIAFMLLEYSPLSEYKDLVALYRDPNCKHMSTKKLDKLYFKLNLNKYNGIF